jgi:hypothetical protein
MISYLGRHCLVGKSQVHLPSIAITIVDLPPLSDTVYRVTSLLYLLLLQFFIVVALVVLTFLSLLCQQKSAFLVSIYVYLGVARFITNYVTGGYIFALYDRLVN